MSLRGRLLAAIALALVLCLAAGSLLATREAARMVEVEVDSAAETALQDIAPERLPEDETALRRLVGRYDGSRHISVALTTATGHVAAASSPRRPDAPAPSWFAAMVTPPLAARRMPIRNTGLSLRIMPDPANEIAERWNDARDRIMLLGLLSLLTGGLCFFTVEHGLRPLAALADGFLRLARGERRIGVKAAGPPEIAALAAGFNRMAEALAEAEASNTRLNSQILRLADEERREIGRDLHDEIGPLLFAMTIFTATAGRLIEAGTPAGVPAQLRAIDDSVATIQAAVRDMLTRLRDTQADLVDLRAGLDKLIRFWQTIRPETRFSLDAPANLATVHGQAAEVLYRVAQEAVSNAVRHAAPHHVTVSLRENERFATLSVADDGAGVPEPGGFGLIGMHERVTALGGTLGVVQGAGWMVTARVPIA